VNYRQLNRKLKGYFLFCNNLCYFRRYIGGIQEIANPILSIASSDSRKEVMIGGGFEKLLRFDTSNSTVENESPFAIRDEVSLHPTQGKLSLFHTVC
jgi:hypothetical protein